MRNYFIIGPVQIRVSSKGIAPWGYARVKIAGLSLLSRMNTGDLLLAAYHPKWSLTWRWSVQVSRTPKSARAWIERAKLRRGQWNDYYRLPFGWQILVSQQNYMRKRQLTAYQRPEGNDGH